jgi:integrase
MKVTFFIRTTQKNKEKPVKIRVKLRDGANIRIFGNSQQYIAPKNWSNKQQRPILRDDYNYDEIKENLQRIERDIEKAYLKEPKKQELGQDWLNEVIDKTLHPEKYNDSLSLFQFIEKFIEEAKTNPNPKTGRPVSYKQRRLYEQTYDDLKTFCQQKGREYSWNDIDLDFYYDFVDYLNNKEIKKRNSQKVQKGMATNTVGKRIQTIKVFLNAASDKGYDVNPSFKSHRFKAISEESESIYLNENELQELFDYDLSNNKRLDKVRDLFLVSAWTGLRFGDVTRITKDNIEDNEFINITQSKTGDPVVIPLHWTVKYMLDKYGGELPKPISNQKFNDYLKELCRIVGIKDEVHKSITIGGKRISQKYEKWQLVTAHAGRRSFATNLYKQGFPALSIMQITGHQSEKSFLKYIKVTPREHAEKLKEFWRQRGDHLRKIE